VAVGPLVAEAGVLPQQALSQQVPLAVPRLLLAALAALAVVLLLMPLVLAALAVLLLLLLAALAAAAPQAELSAGCGSGSAELLHH